jgi:branched-chain amino acid transport system substrate-binding protein
MRIRGKASRFMLAVLVAGLVLGACSSSKKTASGGGSSKGDIAIGVVGTASGPQASSSDQYETVAPAWAAWVNANGGINGHQVKVITEDDAGSPATAQSQVESLINSDHVVAVVVGSDNEVAAFSAFAISKGVPLISGTANATDWYTKSGMFPTPTGVVNGLADQVAAAKAAGAKDFANLYCAEIAACQQAGPLLQNAAKKAGLGYTALAVSSTAPSYTAQCVQLQQQKVDYAQLNFSTDAAVKFIKDCQAQGYNPMWGTSEQAVGPAFYAVPNVTAFGPAYAFPSTADAPPAATFRSAMQQYAKGDNWKEGTGSFTWDGLMALESALKTATTGGSSATSASVASGLYALKGSTLNGELANPIGWVQGKPAGLLTYNPCYFTLEVKSGQLTAPNGLTPQCPSS